MTRGRFVAVVLTLIIAVGVVTPSAQGRFWVLVNGALRYTGTVIVNIGGIASTSTDSLTLQNQSAATAGTTVQMSPRLKWCGAAYNSTSTLSETDCWFAENLPATVAGTTTSTLKFGSTINGGAATYPFTVDSVGNTVALGNTTIGSGNSAVWSGRFLLSASSDGNAVLRNGTGSIGVDLKIDALPTVASGFGTSPSITAGSTPFAGSVNVGTGGAATSGVINFNGTAFPSAPFCVANDSVTTLAQRASATTTQLTITSAAWTASDVVTWVCVSSK